MTGNQRFAIAMTGLFVAFTLGIAALAASTFASADGSLQKTIVIAAYGGIWALAARACLRDLRKGLGR